MATDLLRMLPGLTPQPEPGTPAGEQMIAELAFALADVEGHEAIAATILRFMLRRGYWPLGTKVTVGADLMPHAKFPPAPRLPPPSGGRTLVASLQDVRTT